jgi:hypothetical protein
MHKSATKCNETICKWCKNKHGASKIIDTLKTYHFASPGWITGTKARYQPATKALFSTSVYSTSAYFEVYWRGRGAGLSLQLTHFLDFLSYAKMADVSSDLMLFLAVWTWISVSTTR